MGIRLAARSVFAFFFTAAFLFVPAGTFRFWQAWAFLAILFIPMFVSAFYFYKKDPQLVERRMRTEETIGAQKIIIGFAKFVFLAGFLIPGFDHRYRWSRVPLWLTIASLALALAGYLVTFWVLETNSFASRTIGVDAGQKVISIGPYHFVRHPMYFGAVVMLLFTPLALGSYWALPVFALIVPLIIFRLLNEEKILREQLPGYSDYCLQTHYHLIPFIW